MNARALATLGLLLSALPASAGPAEAAPLRGLDAAAPLAGTQPVPLGPRLVRDPVPAGARLRVTLGSAGAVAASGIALWAASAIETGSDDVASCRWCEPGAVDRWARERLRWRDEAAAAEASDVLLLAVPLASAAAAGWLGAREGGAREAIEDVLVVAAAVAIADPLTMGVKHAAGRLRPEPWEAGGPRAPGDLRSFVSGHTSRVFAASVAAAQVARLRGRAGWGWVAGIGLAAAATTGWLRTAADQHWATDVLGGAALGASVGWLVPPLALRRAGARRSAVAVRPAPGGLALDF